jgi:hypothetical protein
MICNALETCINNVQGTTPQIDSVANQLVYTYNAENHLCKLYAEKETKNFIKLTIDGANVLLFYNGRVELKDTEGAWINFGLSDDIVEFERLNEGEPCWIWSMNWDYSGTHLRYLPMFSRYKTNANGWVTHSWDFGTPKQLYVPDYNIDSSSDIYTRYWKSYINDEFNADTREVDLKVRFQGRVNPDFLMNFVYFDGCWWKIMEITDYNPCSQECTKVKLVKVQDINNYLI